jgi:hypothetical protein
MKEQPRYNPPIHFKLYSKIQKSWNGTSVKRWFWVHPETGRHHGPFQQQGGAFGDARLHFDANIPIAAITTR